MKTNERSLSNRQFPSLKGPAIGYDHGCKITLHFLAGLLSCLSFVHVTFAIPQKAKSDDAQAATSSIKGNINVITSQGQANKLSGVTVKLTEVRIGSALQSTLTDESGHFQFAQLAAGTYMLEVSAESFKPWNKTVALGQGQSAAEDVTLEINSVDQQIEVRGETFE